MVQLVAKLPIASLFVDSLEYRIVLKSAIGNCNQQD